MSESELNLNSLLGTPFLKPEWLEKLYFENLIKIKKLLPVSCLCTWMDICGFGDKLLSVNWNLKKALDEGLLDILSNVYSAAAYPLFFNTPPDPSERILILNDGISRTLDLYPESAFDEISMAFYIRNLILLHYYLYNVLHRNELGIRTILSGGERIQYSPMKITGESLLYHNPDGPSANGELFMKQVFLYHPAEFQMNTAFSRSFIIDSSGTKLGIKPNRIYIDYNCINRINKILYNFIKIEGDDQCGVIILKKNEDELLSLGYDEVIHYNNYFFKTKIFKLNNMVVHEYLEGEKTDIPLIPDEILRVISEEHELRAHKKRN